jgi:hypothetical protein
MIRSLRTLPRAVALVALTVLVAGCSNGQLVDAGGERGSGGLAFVLLAAFFGVFLGSLFYMDRVRQRRMDEDEKQDR